VGPMGPGRSPRMTSTSFIGLWFALYFCCVPLEISSGATHFVLGYLNRSKRPNLHGPTHPFTKFEPSMCRAGQRGRLLVSSLWPPRALPPVAHKADIINSPAPNPRPPSPPPSPRSAAVCPLGRCCRRQFRAGPACHRPRSLADVYNTDKRSSRVYLRMSESTCIEACTGFAELLLRCLAQFI
jgi:hypothetical protein